MDRYSFDFFRGLTFIDLVQVCGISNGNGDPAVLHKAINVTLFYI